MHFLLKLSVFLSCRVFDEFFSQGLGESSRVASSPTMSRTIAGKGTNNLQRNCKYIIAIVIREHSSASAIDNHNYQGDWPSSNYVVIESGNYQLPT